MGFLGQSNNDTHTDQDNPSTRKDREPRSRRTHTTNLHGNLHVRVEPPFTRDLPIPAKLEHLVDALVGHHLGFDRAQRNLNTLNNRGLPPYLLANPTTFKPPFSTKTRVLDALSRAHNQHIENLTRILRDHYNAVSDQFQRDRGNTFVQLGGFWHHADAQAASRARMINHSRSRRARSSPSDSEPATQASQPNRPPTKRPQGKDSRPPPSAATTRAPRSPPRPRSSSRPSTSGSTTTTSNQPTSDSTTQPGTPTSGRTTPTQEDRALELAQILTKYFNSTNEYFQKKKEDRK